MLCIACRWRLVLIPAPLWFDYGADLDRDWLFNSMVVLLANVFVEVSATAADYKFVSLCS
jgi:hypothetical protein